MSSQRHLLRLLAGLGVALAAVAAAAGVLIATGGSGSPAVEHLLATGGPEVAAANRDVDPGSSAGGGPAPGFTLRDQRDRSTSLAQFRGKVVVLAFVDSHCTTICPLTTQSMVEALRLLGPLAARVQLLGINANPLATRVADVAAYTRAHRMQGRWRFLTGSRAQLARVWRGYHVYVAAIHNNIDHEPIVYLVDGRGRLRTVYFTQMSYAGIDQQAQLLADGIARLLLGHPSVRHAVSLRYVSPLTPTETLGLPALGSSGRTVVLGRAHPHLLLFFATWLQEGSSLSAELAALDRYAVVAHQRAWPSPVAINELSTEASANDARTLLRRFAATLHVPIVEDRDGRLADGYRVRDQPWFALTSPSGRILWHHDGWLSATALSQRVHAALAGR